MILAQYNILKAYEVKASRHWDNTANQTGAIVLLATNVVPPIQLAVSAGTTATIQLYTSLDVAVGSPISMVVTDMTTHVRLNYLGETLTGGEVQVAGYYYMKVTNGADTYYFDVFEWRDDLTGLFKVAATSSNINVGGYVFDLTNFTYLCYLGAEYRITEQEDEEYSTEDNGTISPYYTGTSRSRIWVVDGCEYIYEFLLGLRLLDVNGSVTITWNYIDYSADDILVEIDNDHGGADLLDIEVRIKPSNEIMKVINSTN